MYLFTIVFIFLTIIGVFTEVLSLQNNRFGARQTVGASVMATWHNAVVSAARYTVAGTPVFAGWGAGGVACTVMATGAPPASAQAPACPDASGAAAPVLLDALVVAPGPVTVNDLLPPPPGGGAPLSFQSVIFTAAGGTNARLAVTFINPAANPGTPVPPTGYTSSQLYRQLARVGMDKTSYGYVVGNQLQPAASVGPGLGAYPIPNGPGVDLMAPTGPIQNGAIVLFSLL